MTTNPAKPVCRLVGTDGNVFSIIGRVRQYTGATKPG